MEEERKPKVLFVSDLVVPTGFSTVAHNIIKHNRNHLDIIGLGINYKGDPHDYDFPIFPAMNNPMGNIYGVDRLVNLILSNKDLDVVYILNDAWVISYYLQAIKEHVKENLPKIVVYFPVDSSHHNKQWYKDFDIVNRAFTYTKFGRDVVKACRPDLNIEIIPHGIDSQTFYRMSTDRGQAKKEIYKNLQGIERPEDSWLVLNANRNQPRKKLDITIKGFAMFAVNKPENVRLYMHCGVIDSDIDVRLQALRYGCDHRLLMTNLNPGVQKVSLEKLNLIYNACDVGINTSMGEGWGLTNVEHAITGAPQIVPRHSACDELFSDCGLLMDNITEFTFSNSQTVGQLTTAEEVARCLEVIYRNRELYNELSLRTMKKFLQPEYQWSNIAEKWREVFLEVSKKEDATNISQ